MSDEIKEILEFKENADYKRLSIDEIKCLDDYITNLQKENKNLTKAIELNRVRELHEENERLKELINQHEEEHTTTFEEWKRDIKAFEELEKYIESFDEDYLFKETFLSKIKELKDSDKE